MYLELKLGCCFDCDIVNGNLYLDVMLKVNDVNFKFCDVSFFFYFVVIFV